MAGPSVEMSVDQMAASWAELLARMKVATMETCLVVRWAETMASPLEASMETTKAAPWDPRLADCLEK